MDNKDFDKIFAHKFGQIPGDPYQEQNWSELSGRMDVHERRRKRWVLFAVWPLFAMLATGNIFWWHQWKQAQQSNLVSATAHTVIQYDTLVHRTVIFDTVYQQVTLMTRQDFSDPYMPISTTLSQKKQAPQQTLDNAENLSKTTGTNTANTDALVAHIPDKQPEAGTQKDKIATSEIEAPGHTISHRVPLPDSLLQQENTQANEKKPSPDSLFEHLLLEKPLVKKTRSSGLMLAHPRLSILAGWANPLLSHKRSGALFGTGLGADVQVAKQIRLGADVQYWRGKLRAEETDELTGVEVPNPGADYILHYWETYKLPVVSYDLHLKYYFNSSGKWAPWIGLGTQWNTTLPFDIEFDYENQSSHYEVFLPAQTHAITHWQGLTGLLGVEGTLSKHCLLEAGAFFLQKPGSNPGLLGKQFGLKTRLIYQF
ncbi:MAG: hypothetical protein JNM22_15065 [Saprospiraceae bacterium]|nr:hypothetical protein [Saprospiraceae bacterium]